MTDYITKETVQYKVVEGEDNTVLTEKVNALLCLGEGWELRGDSYSAPCGNGYQLFQVMTRPRNLIVYDEGQIIPQYEGE